MRRAKSASLYHDSSASDNRLSHGGFVIIRSGYCVPAMFKTVSVRNVSIYFFCERKKERLDSPLLGNSSVRSATSLQENFIILCTPAAAADRIANSIDLGWISFATIAWTWKRKKKKPQEIILCILLHFSGRLTNSLLVHDFTQVLFFGSIPQHYPTFSFYSWPEEYVWVSRCIWAIIGRK